MSREAITRRRKVVLPFHYSSDKKLVHVVASMRDRPGALAETLNALGSIVDFVGTTTYRTESGRAIFSGVGELISEVGGAVGIEAALEPLKSVAAAKVWESKDGLLVDEFHTGIETGMGEPYIMLPTAGLAQTFDKVVKTFGSGGETILYLEGKHFGLARFELYKKVLGPSPEAKIEEGQYIFEALGYGTSHIEVLESGRLIRMSRKDCFECAGQLRNGHSCAFSRGLASGIFEAMYGRPMSCDEVACRMKGADACEFELRASGPDPSGKA